MVPMPWGKYFAFVKDGKLNDSDLAWHAGMGNEWKKLGNLLAGLEEGEKVNQVQELVDKILKLVEREEFELATDLILGCASLFSLRSCLTVPASRVVNLNL